MKPLSTAGAPYALGHAQGRVLRDRIVEAVREQRTQYGSLTWLLMLSQIRSGSGKSLQRFLPQIHERLEGIAAGARVQTRALELIETQPRVAGLGTVRDGGLEARLELAPELESQLLLRQTRPDACGFASVELTTTVWAGCLAGVNTEGVGAIVLEDPALDRPSLRVLAQDMIFRSQEIGAGLDHLGRRAKYMRASGRMLAIGIDGNAFDVRLDNGDIRTEPLAEPVTAAAQSTVRIDPATATLEWTRSPNETESLTPGSAL